jgi:hypothetical protein
MGGDHEVRGENPKQRCKSARRKERYARGRKMAKVERGDLGFNLSPLSIATVLNGALTVHNVFTKNFRVH